jgi:hypothetical protein
MSFFRRGPHTLAALPWISTLPGSSVPRGLSLAWLRGVDSHHGQCPTAAAQASELPRPTIGKCEACEGCAVEGTIIMPSIAMPRNGPTGGFESGSRLPAHHASRITCLQCCAIMRVIWASPRGVWTTAQAGYDTENAGMLDEGPGSLAQWLRRPSLAPLPGPRQGPEQVSRDVSHAIKNHHRSPVGGTAARAARHHSAGSAGAQKGLMPRPMPFVLRPSASSSFPHPRSKTGLSLLLRREENNIPIPSCRHAGTIPRPATTAIAKGKRCLAAQWCAPP